MNYLVSDFMGQSFVFEYPSGRAICMCTRAIDATNIATALNRGAQPPQDDNTAIAQCKCAVKRTEVSGLGILYAQMECPIHGYLHGAHC